MLNQIERNARWLEKMHGEQREKVEVEIGRQKRALIKYLDGEMPKRTARRIIDRSSKRVAWIVAGGYEQ